MNNAQALVGSQRAIQRCNAYVPMHGQVLPGRQTNQKLIIAAGSVGFLILVIFTLTHMGTYNIALTLPIPHLSSSQPDVQPRISATTTATTTNASTTLVRINQTDTNQYLSQSQHDQWYASACSAAAMAEVINAYGHHYKIGNILSVESAIGAISQSQGLLTPAGIDQTAVRFGFATQTLSNPTLQQVLDVANGGRPVIINFPPQPGTVWAGGHFLVLLGGSIDGGIRLADSSTVNNGNGLQLVYKSYLDRYWRGFAKVLTPLAYSAVSDTPSMSIDSMNQILGAYHSPASGKGQSLYDLGVQYGIDPAFALAFFMHESSFGTQGEATKSLSLGNIRCIPNYRCEDNFAQFDSWEEGFKAWYELIRNLYVNQWGLTTVDTIIPRYAPAADHNDEAAYINALKHALDTWHSGQILVH